MGSQAKIRVGLVYGGISPEHKVSTMSAKGILDNIDTNRFEVIPIFIDKDGEFSFADSEDVFSLSVMRSVVDVVFPTLHGKGGEDGSIQGLLDTLKIPYIGSGVLASALCLDKAVCNRYMESHGFLKPRSEELDTNRLSKKEYKIVIDRIVSEFKFPVFVKPARGGSSVGVGKASKADELALCITSAVSIDNKIVIEESVEDCLEIEVSVMGNNEDDISVSVPGRAIPSSEFYDYDDKYTSGTATVQVPVELPENVLKEIQELARSAYKIANCRGLARVDFFLDIEHAIYLNEINTMPGFTPTSMYPKLWEASGVSYRQLITKLIELALVHR